MIPLDEKGKLNYTKYLGGSKYRLSELQDCYHAEVGSKYNLDRGNKATTSLQELHDNLLEKYHSLKRRFDRLSED